MMNIRLHSASTLDEAAQWLSEETTETWNSRAVLERLLKGWQTKGDAEFRLLPEWLTIVVPFGSVLLDRVRGVRHTTERPQTMLIGGIALESFLERLLQFGEASFVTVGVGSDRWLCESSLLPEHVRLDSAMVDSLVPEFDRLNLSMNATELSAPAETQQQRQAQTMPILQDAASTPAWKTQAQSCAREIISRQAKRDLYPSQIAIADEIAREFRAAGTSGLDGKPLSGAYIKRHALSGISSAIGKSKSTAIHRGK